MASFGSYAQNTVFYFSCLFNTLVLTCDYVHVFNTWLVSFQMFDNKNLFPEYEHMDSTTVVLSELQGSAMCHQAMADLWGEPQQ